MKEQGVNLEKAREETLKAVGEGAHDQELLGFTPRTKRIFELSFLEARNLGHNYVGTEHMILGLLAEGEGVAVVILKKLGADIDKIKSTVLGMITETNKKGPGPAQQAVNKNTPSLNKYATDLNKMAEDGKIDPVIGRTKEIERVVQILSRRTKNNPVLIGEPGVGKTAIAEGLAQKIVEGNVPDIILDKKIFALDLPGMIAGAKYRGEFEERLKSIMAELQKQKDLILFIMTEQPHF